MKVNRVYRRCHLSGKGELHTPTETISFEIHDISASGASIEINIKLDESLVYDLKITFIGHLIDISIHPKVKITRMYNANERYLYGINFIDLSENDRVQIDEIVNYQCMVDNQTLGENCDEGSCLFIKNKQRH